jgi:multiple antibiotic resistance protein
MTASSGSVTQVLLASGEAAVRTVELDQIFLFLFGAMGPFNVIARFAAITRGREAGFKRRLALQGTGVAAVALLVAATLGAQILRNWSVSTEALLLTGGIILFLIALRGVLQQYTPLAPPADPPGEETIPSRWLAFSPLAFPTIVTPFGVAVLVIALRLRPGTLAVAEILALVALVLTLDLLGMVFADRILHTPLVSSALLILGSVMVVLQVALGVEIVLYALRLLGIVPG